MSIKETNKQKIQRFYTINKVNKSYEDIVEKHRNWLLTDWEFIFEADKIYNAKWRSGFITLQEVRKWQLDERIISNEKNN